MKKEELILVDERDREIGTMEKLKVHEKGKLHRAFSTYIFSPKGYLLLQQRALGKYHCPEIWSNTACGHPRPGEKVEDAAHRRLQEEMGISVPMREIGSFIYRAEFDNELIEHEYLHIFAGKCGNVPKPNEAEVMDWSFMPMDELRRSVKTNPATYSFWLRETLKRFDDAKFGL